MYTKRELAKFSDGSLKRWLKLLEKHRRQVIDEMNKRSNLKIIERMKHNKEKS